jgi:hypothetical protein
MKNKFLRISLILMLLTSSILCFAQTIVTTEAIYGGRINTIVSLKTSPTAGTIFVSTESANSIFKATVSTPAVGAPSVGTFSVLPCANAAANLGSGIYSMATHTTSQTLVFVANNTLYKTTTPYTTASVVATGVNDVTLKGATLMYLTPTKINWGTLDGSGNYTAGGSCTHTLSGSSKLLVGVDEYLYAFNSGTSPTLYKSSDVHTAFSASTSFSSISTTPLSTSVNWGAFGMGPDGRLFIGGASSSKQVAYSDNSGVTWTTVATGLSGVTGSNFAFYPTSVSTYKVFFAKGYSSDNGATWAEFGNAGFQTHPNDGVVHTIPPSALYNADFGVCMTTDQGLGMSTNGGSIITEIDNGIEAVQVNDFDMNDTKTDGWLASKAGIRSVSNFNTTPVWSLAMFPNGDGSPYYSAEMIGNTTNSAYVGNVRVYKTTNGGTTWSQVFTAENAPYNFQSAAQVTAVKVCPTNTSLVLAGYKQQGGNRGGVFYSADAGATWTQMRIVATSDGQDVNVNDIAFNTEGGTIVAYIGVDYQSVAPISYSIYRAVWNGTTWTVAQDMAATETALGHAYIVSIADIHVSTTKDTLLASGFTSSNAAAIYYRIKSGANKWTYLTTYVAGASTVGSVTMGVDTVFYSLNNSIYAKKFTGGSGVYYTYPNGTQINFLYYDALLAGSGTGMQGIQTSNLVLPIELTGFSVRLMAEKTALLTWQTAYSTNFKGFEVQKAENVIARNEATEGGKNLDFKQIGFVADKEKLATYDFTDAAIVEGKTYYYRLKQMDKDGSFTYSKVVALSILNKEKDWQLYPNPSKNVVTINFYQLSDGETTIQITDLTGRIVKNYPLGILKNGQNQAELPTHDLANGVYICRLSTSTSVLMKQLVIEK